MAVVAGNIVLLVLAGIPKREVAIALITQQANRGLLLGGNGFVVESEDSGYTATATGLGVLERVGVAGH